MPSRQDPDPEVRRAKDSDWCVYMVRCRLGSLYTGITNDLERRLQQHAAGTGAKYLRGRGPLRLVFSLSVADKSAALLLERRIKRLSRAGKQRLVDTRAIEI